MLTHGQAGNSQAVRQQTSAEYLAALKEFEAAVRQFQRKKYEKASELFTKLTESRAHDVADRARIHLRLCEQKQKSEAAAPKNPEEFYLRGVAALNTGNLDDALDFLAKAHKLRPNVEHIQYALAAAHARQGNTDAAIERLKSAIELRSENRAQARRDDDFQSLSNDLRFIRLVKPNAG
jgi:tetratricopeptide (TPR) repeat protein